MALDTERVDKDREFNGGFCWSAQDRARANSPFTAPRKSSVFSASVFFGSVASVPAPCPSNRSRLHSTPSRVASSCPVRGRIGEGTVRRGCCNTGFPGQSWFFHESPSKSDHHLQIPGAAAAMSSESWKGGIVPGPGYDTNAPHSCALGQAKSGPTMPDWRVIGEQDFPEPF